MSPADAPARPDPVRPLLLALLALSVAWSGAVPQTAGFAGSPSPRTSDPEVAGARFGGAGIETISHGPGGLDVVIAFPSCSVDTVRQGDRDYHVPKLAGWALNGAFDRPVTLERTFYIALPPAGDVTVDWSVDDEESMAGLTVPVMTPGPSPGDSYVSEGVRDLRDVPPDTAGEPMWRRFRAGDASHPRTVVGEPAWLRFQRVLPVTVRLWSLDGTGLVRELRRLRITARFEPLPATATRRVPVVANGGLHPDILNPEEAGRWLAAPLSPAGGEPHIFGMTPNPWLKVRVPERGVYRVDRDEAQAAGFPVDEVDLSTLRMFAGDQLPVSEVEFVDSLPAVMQECAIRVEDGGAAGVWDDGDAVLFAANGPDGWYGDRLSEDRGFERYVSHSSSPYGVCWLTWGGTFPGEPKRIPVVDVDDGGLAPRVEGEARLHVERNTFYDPRPKTAGLTWEKFYFQQALADASNLERVVTFDATGVVAGEASRVRARYWGATWNPGGIIPDHFLIARLNGVDVASVSWESLDPMDIENSVVALGEGENQWQYYPPFMEDPGGNVRRDRIYLSWIEVDYVRELRAQNDSLAFFGPAGESPVVFEASGFSSSSVPQAYNVTDPWNPYLLAGSAEADGPLLKYTFADAPAPGFQPHYVVLDSSRARSPEALETVERQGQWLRDRAGAVDMIIITHEILRDPAEELAAYRRQVFPGRESAVVEVVTVDQIYDEFSWGLVDVTALRNFLDFAYLHWADPGDPGRRPLFITFLGDPYYDQRNYLREGGVQLVPNYQDHYTTGYRFSIYNPQSSSDDWMTLLYDTGTEVRDELPDLFSGRIPVENRSQAADVVQKIIDYEQNAPLTWWRTRFVDIADDFCQGAQVDGLWDDHTLQSELLIDAAIPYCMHPDRIYLVEYGTVCPTPTKPGATEDFFQAVEEGALVVNYTGHGSEGQLSDERIFDLSNVESLNNVGKPFLFVNASCSVGKHDQPGVGLGEAMVRQRNKGAIAVFAAASLASSGASADLNQDFYMRLFPGRVFSAVQPLGVAAVEAKLLQGTQGNARRYVVLGDPALRLASPRHEIEVHLLGGPGIAADADTLIRGAKARVEGAVRDTSGALLDDFDGTVDLRIYDSERLREPCSPLGCVDYELLGAPIFRGEVPVVSGLFELDFVVPRSLLLGERGVAKIFAYAQDGSRDASGCRHELLVPDDLVVTSDDQEGPAIQLALASGDSLARPGDEMFISLEDSSGINITGLRGSLSIVLRYNDSAGRPVLVEDLASRLRYSGSATYAEITVNVPQSLQTGRTYTVVVSAADNLNNTSHASMVMRLVQAGTDALTLGRLFNFPNPMETATAFFLEVDREVDIRIDIYTSTGRKIQRLTWDGTDPEDAWRRGLRWDGRDADGDELGNGVYFYRVRVRDRENGDVITRTERLAVLR